MKNLLYLYILVLFVHCKPEKNTETGIIEYLKWDNDTNYNYREFQSVSDSTLTKIFIAQRWENIDDSTWQFEYTWRNIDSMPINKSIERYTPNRVELIAQYIYELGENNKIQEVAFDIGKNNSCVLNSGGCSFDASAKFVIDSTFQMQVHTDMIYTFKQIDSLPENKRDCLVVTSDDRISFNFSDSRRDTVITTKGIRIYSKGVGLIFFSDFDGTNKVTYTLKN